MAANITLPMLPNPLTPLAFLPPSLADEFETITYVYVASLGAFLWDWLMSMPDEYRILRHGSITRSKVVYLLSRISTLGFSITTTMFQVSSVDNCQSLLYAVGAFTILELMTNSLLFLFRVRAIYSNSKVITVVFGFLWLCVIGTAFLVPLGLEGIHIGPTRRCVNNVFRSWVAAPIVTLCVNNTLVFIAISYRIVSQSIHGNSWRVRAISFFRGDGVPTVARDLLQGGQLFYLASILMGIAQAVLVLGPVYKALLSIPAVALENAMACRVYRAVALGFISTDGTQRGRTGPFMFTTVVSGSDASNDTMLREYRLDRKGESTLYPGERTDLPAVQQTETLSDRV